MMKRQVQFYAYKRKNARFSMCLFYTARMNYIHVNRTDLVLDAEVDLLQMIVFENFDGHRVLLVVIVRLQLLAGYRQICSSARRVTTYEHLRRSRIHKRI